MMFPKARGVLSASFPARVYILSLSITFILMLSLATFALQSCGSAGESSTTPPTNPPPPPPDFTFDI